jgi:hypothetical protein
VAGLLELADQEFVEIRSYLDDYVNALPQRIEHRPDTVGIDLESVEVLVHQDSYVAEVDGEIASSHNAALADGSLSTSVERLVRAGFKTIAEVQAAMHANRSEIVKYADLLMPASGSADAKINRGVSLFYLAYVHVLKARDEKRFESFLESSGIGAAKVLLLETWNQVDA